jgi:hypothetical protein
VAQQIVYCDRCARMISPAEMLKGNALVTAGATICVECAAALSDEERARLSPLQTADDAPTQAERQPRRSSSIRRLPEQPPDGSRQRVLLGIVGGLAGILAGIAGAIVVVRGGRGLDAKPMPSPTGVQLRSPDITARTPAPVVESKAGEAPAENPAGKRLEEIRSGGAIPVFGTMPMYKPADESASKLVESYNAMVLGLSETKAVPVIDMFSLLNDDADILPRLFTPRGGLKAAAYQSMASALASAYKQLERYVMGRRVESVPIRSEAVADGAAVEPIETSRLGPNLIADGGFEESGPDGRSSGRWRFHNWGKDDARWNARLDRANFHSGARSLQVLASSQEAQPGAFTSFSADAGTYEVSFWACADTDGKVGVRAHLAGTDIAPLTAGEEWKRLSVLVEVKERQANASLKLWISTQGVRVWLDDVEVRRLKD